MKFEKDTIKCEAIFNDERTHRFLWKQVWDNEKPLVCVVMLNPCQASTVISDTTTYLVVNNIYKLGDYGGITIVNLFSLLTQKLRTNTGEKLNDKVNDSYIKKAAEEASVVILAWGKSVDTNQKLYDRSREVIDLLSKQKEKLRIIGDGAKAGSHPLSPYVRSRWVLQDPTEWLKASKPDVAKAEPISVKKTKVKRDKNIYS